MVGPSAGNKVSSRSTCNLERCPNETLKPRLRPGPHHRRPLLAPWLELRTSREGERSARVPGGGNSDRAASGQRRPASLMIPDRRMTSPSSRCGFVVTRRSGWYACEAGPVAESEARRSCCWVSGRFPRVRSTVKTAQSLDRTRMPSRSAKRSSWARRSSSVVKRDLRTLWLAQHLRLLRQTGSLPSVLHALGGGDAGVGDTNLCL